MSKKSRLREPFDKQDGRGDQKLLKSDPQHLYHIYWSLSTQLIWKKSLLVICKILELFIKTLNAGHKYSLLNRENSKKPILMQLSQKQKLFSQLVSVFLKSKLNFEYFQIKRTLMAYVFPKLETPKNVVKKYLRSSVSENPSWSNAVRGNKHCWNLNYTTFAMFIDHCEENWVGKNVS